VPIEDASRSHAERYLATIGSPFQRRKATFGIKAFSGWLCEENISEDFGVRLRTPKVPTRRWRWPPWPLWVVVGVGLFVVAVVRASTAQHPCLDLHRINRAAQLAALSAAVLLVGSLQLSRAASSREVAAKIGVRLLWFVAAIVVVVMLSFLIRTDPCSN